MKFIKSYWVWGLFSLSDSKFLNKIKSQVQSELNSPIFDTHITLAGPYLEIKKSFLNKIKSFVKYNSEINLEVNGYEFKQKTYESLYISIKYSENLRNLRRNIYELKNFDFNKNYSPHVSLLYGNYTINEKKSLILKLPIIDRDLRISQIALTEVNESINLWKIINIFKLNPILFED